MIFAGVVRGTGVRGAAVDQRFCAVGCGVVTSLSSMHQGWENHVHDMFFLRVIDSIKLRTRQSSPGCSESRLTPMWSETT